MPACVLFLSLHIHTQTYTIIYTLYTHHRYSAPFALTFVEREKRTASTYVVMDPCLFVRIVVGNLALKFPAASKSSSPCFFCKIKIKNFASQTTSIPLISQDNCDEHVLSSTAVCFNLNKSQFDKLIDQSSSASKPYCLNIEVYTGRRDGVCGLKSGKLLGCVSVPLDLKGAESRVCAIRNGWIVVSDKRKGSPAQLHLNVKAEPDPRFVFQFDGEPECSPQVFQVNGSIRQPVFTCKFSFRNSGERHLTSRSSLSQESTPRSWLSSHTSDEQPPSKERKGWSITVHDLYGSPVAAASMVTPFVPSPGTDRVSRSNPGAWLILRPGHGTWKPWGRLEAWRERGDALGYRFALIPDAAFNGGTEAVTVANSTLSSKNGGKFTIDISTDSTPVNSPGSSFDFGSGSWSEPGSGSWAQIFYGGFVMSSTVEGVRRCSEPEVEVGVQHVTCTEDAAVFVALAAAMDLSMDACRLFSHKLRKELRQQSQECVV
ncbi:uncharacterized protein LOC132300136 [Cornus florida]|uniref:uncharacterized protein LOC132300136 n=1 Tax=Cornus florida TaxID=4283 RepID=UPI0028A1C9FD|nr:uncharacterized protein LOC132300136 [Cornus florida]